MVCNKQGVLPTTVTKRAYYTIQEVKNRTEEQRRAMTVLL